jgi:hypothetical protein
MWFSAKRHTGHGVSPGSASTQPRLRESTQAQQIGQQRGVPDVVLHPPVLVADDPQRMGQMQPGTALGDHVDRPLPAPARLHRHLRLRPAGGDDLSSQISWRVVDPTPRHPLALIVQHDDNRSAPMQIDPHIRTQMSLLARGLVSRNLKLHPEPRTEPTAGRLNPPTNSTWDHLVAAAVDHAEISAGGRPRPYRGASGSGRTSAAGSTMAASAGDRRHRRAGQLLWPSVAGRPPPATERTENVCCLVLIGGRMILSTITTHIYTRV